MPNRLFRIRVLLLLMLAGTILSTGASYWLGERRMQADLEFLKSQGAVTEIRLPQGKGTYEVALDYWYGLPASTRSEANKWIETYKITRYKESKQALADLNPLIKLVEEAAQQPTAEWKEMDEAMYSFAGFFASKAVLEASEGKFEEALASVKVLRNMSKHSLDYGGIEGLLVSRTLDSVHASTAFTLARYPQIRHRLVGEILPLPAPSLQQLLKQEVARSLSMTETAEYRDAAPALAKLPEDLPRSVSLAAVGNRAVKRAVKHKLVRAWAEVIPFIDAPHEELAEKVRSTFSKMARDNSFSGRIAAARFENVLFITDKLTAIQKDDQQRTQRLRALLK